MFDVFLFFGLSLIIIGYVMQLIEALRQREPPQDAQRRKVWRTVAMIFLVPLLVSVVVSISDAMLSGPTQTTQATLGYLLKLETETIQASLTIVQAMLLIFISLELSHLTLPKMHKTWRELLIIALVLDVASLIFVYAVRYDGSGFYESCLLLGVLSLLSSFAVVLFSRESVEKQLEEAT